MLPQCAVSNSDLLAACQDGDESAWQQMVERYQPLVDAITRRYRVPACDADDVSQHVWVQLLSHAARLRDPRALPGWIATTATRRCYEILRAHRRAVALDPSAFVRSEAGPWPGAGQSAGVDDDLLRAERRGAVRRALAELTDAQQQLLLLLASDPPISYREIGARLGLPVGSIGPTRARLLRRLGRSTAVRDLRVETRPELAAVA